MTRYLLIAFASMMIVLSPVMVSAQEQMPDDPATVYETYHAHVLKGLSFEKERTFFSKRKVSTLDQKIADMMERTGKTEQEVIELYQSVSTASAKCRDITLENKEISGDTAFLTYAQNDKCDPDNSPGPQKVKMVLENGTWKIDEIVIDL